MSVHPLKSCACAAALLFSAALLGSNSAQAANVGGIEISDCVPGAKNCKAGNTSQTTGPSTGSSSGKPSGGNTGSMGQNGRPCPAIWARRGLCTPQGSASSNAGPWNQGGDRPCRGRRCADGYGGSANAGPWDSGGRPCRGRRCANQDGYGGVYRPTGGRPGGYDEGGQRPAGGYSGSSGGYGGGGYGQGGGYVPSGGYGGGSGYGGGRPSGGYGTGW